MSEDRIDAYAAALFNVAQAEGNIDTVEDELFRFGRALEGSDALKNALTDDMVPAAKRQAVVEDLLYEVAGRGHRGGWSVGHVGSGSEGPGRRSIGIV